MPHAAQWNHHRIFGPDLCGAQGLFFRVCDYFELLRNQFHCQEALRETDKSSLNSGKLNTNKAVWPGITVVGLVLLTKGL
jgi:hypothetical protein